PGTGRPDLLDDRDHVERRDPLRDAEDRLDSGRGGFHHRVGGAGSRHEDARGVGAGLADGVGHRVEDRNASVERRLAAFARGHPRDDLGAVLEHRLAVEGSFAAGQAVHDGPAGSIDEDAHATAAFDAATAWAAASSSVSAVWNCASRRRTSASAAFVPTIRTTIGTSLACCARASMSPRATSSPREIPPTLFTRIALTLVSARIRRIAAATLSARAPPPMSRKFAGSPPARPTRSSAVHAT